MDSRIYIWRGELEAKTPFHIGKGEEGLETDALILRNAKDEPFIPSTTLAGVFRNTLRMLKVDKSSIDILCGSSERRSLLRYEDAMLFSGEPKTSKTATEQKIAKTMTEIRQCVSIHRKCGVAKDKGKFDLETTLKGTKFGFYLELHLEHLENKEKKDEQDNSGDKLKEHVDHVLDAWKKGVLHIGKASSRGLGWFELKIENHSVVHLDKPEELYKWLIFREATSHDTIKSSDTASSIKSSDSASLPLEIQLCLKIEEPFVTKESNYTYRDGLTISGKKASAWDKIPDYESLITRCVDGKYEYLLPGSSLKGPIRAQAERILRKVLRNDKKVCDLTEKSQEFPNCEIRIKELMETKPKNSPDNPKNWSSRQEWEQEVCPACAFFGNTFLKSRILIRDSFGKDCLTKRLDHVALDEFIQGAMDSAKFDGEVIYQGNFQTIIHVCTFDKEAAIPEWQKGLLYLLLRDMENGLIRFGFGKRKGFGKLTIAKEEIENFLKLAGGVENLQEAWRSWYENLRKGAVS